MKEMLLSERVQILFRILKNEYNFITIYDKEYWNEEYEMIGRFLNEYPDCKRGVFTTEFDLLNFEENTEMTIRYVYGQVVEEIIKKECIKLGLIVNIYPLGKMLLKIKNY